MEFVYVVPRGELFPDCYPQGLVPFAGPAEREAFENTVRERGFFVERAYAERTPALQQIIPYTVVSTEGDILLMRRLPKSGEKRLHDKLSIGVGGHINPEDVSTSGVTDPIRAGTQRELDEELFVRGPYAIRPLGFLNDDSNPVGAVHVGLVQLAVVKGSVAIREEDVLEGRLVPPAELRSLRTGGANFESWSSILIDRLDELVPLQEPVAPGSFS